MWVSWRRAMQSALYGPAGFYTASGGAARHFRTSVSASPRFAGAVLALLREVDTALGHPPRVDLVDIGAGRGELLTQVLTAVQEFPGLAGRLVVHAVELTPPPAQLDPRIRWRPAPPPRITGLTIANEWLDSIPLDVAELTARGPRVVLVDPGTGRERLGNRPGAADLAWLERWWPLREQGDRAEIGRPRCLAWTGTLRRIRSGLAVAADYAHVRADRPRRGTLSAYRRGRRVRPVPDGRCDITAHVALDACAEAGHAGGARATVLTTQRDALRALGVAGRRPPLVLAGLDPAGYVQGLSEASLEAELIDTGGLGGFGWLVQAVGMDMVPSLASAHR